jgi:hypothetical protein
MHACCGRVCVRACRQCLRRVACREHDASRRAACVGECCALEGRLRRWSVSSGMCGLRHARPLWARLLSARVGSAFVGWRAMGLAACRGLNDPASGLFRRVPRVRRAPPPVVGVLGYVRSASCTPAVGASAVRACWQCLRRVACRERGGVLRARCPRRVAFVGECCALEAPPFVVGVPGVLVRVMHACCGCVCGRVCWQCLCQVACGPLRRRVLRLRRGSFPVVGARGCCGCVYGRAFGSSFVRWCAMGAVRCGLCRRVPCPRRGPTPVVGAPGVRWRVSCTPAVSASAAALVAMPSLGDVPRARCVRCRSRSRPGRTGSGQCQGTTAGRSRGGVGAGLTGNWFTGGNWALGTDVGRTNTSCGVVVAGGRVPPAPASGLSRRVLRPRRWPSPVVGAPGGALVRVMHACCECICGRVCWQCLCQVACGPLRRRMLCPEGSLLPWSATSGMRGPRHARLLWVVCGRAFGSSSSGGVPWCAAACVGERCAPEASLLPVVGARGICGCACGSAFVRRRAAGAMPPASGLCRERCALDGRLHPWTVPRPAPASVVAVDVARSAPGSRLAACETTSAPATPPPRTPDQPGEPGVASHMAIRLPSDWTAHPTTPGQRARHSRCAPDTVKPATADRGFRWA